MTTTPVLAAAPVAAAPLEKPVDPGIKAAAQEFEAVFLSQMMSHMFEGIKADPVFGGGFGEDVFRGMMIEQYGKHMARMGATGISRQLQDTLIHMQQQR